MENRAKQAIKRLAQEKGVTEEQLISEMEEAIREGWRRSRQTGNTEALKIWESIPKKGEVPTAVEMIAYCCGRLMEAEAAGLIR